jgi:hypothetical protein
MMILERVRASRDDGVVLVMVMWTTGILVLLSAIMVSSAVALQKNARHDQTWMASLAAAQAGVDDYISRLNSDGNYWRFGNPAVAYTGNASAALPSGANVNSAFSTWTNVPGTTRGQFRYEVNSTNYISQGIIRLRSTGRVGKSTRTMETTIRRRGFLDYLYFTNYETLDPAAYPTTQSSLTRAQADAQCRKWWYSGRSFTTGKSVPSANCLDINFSTGDVVNGPLHTNDAFLVCGSPQFKGPTTSSYQTTGARYRSNTTGNCGNASPSFARSGDPAFNGILTLPPNNANIQREVDPAFTANPGCLYAGPTKIVFKNNGTMDVTSPWTRDKSRCGVGTGIAIPTNGVIYVQTVPTITTAPNYWAANATGKPTCVNNGNAIGYPQNSDDSQYPCQAGDVFVEGVMKGQATIASENDIYVTGDLTYQGGVTGGSANDILGLVANNYVYVYHPVNCGNNGCSNVSYSHTDTTSGGSTNTSNSTFSNPIIQAAVLSVQHSFMVQNYTQGNQLGNINLTGAIAQTFRGPVGLIGSTGYLKNYVYDARLKYMSPPHFLDPVQSAFQVTTSAEPVPAYRFNAP